MEWGSRARAALTALIIAVCGCASAPSSASARAYSPYVDVTLQSDPMLPAIQRESGARSLTLGFVIGTAGGCRPSWGGSVALSNRSLRRQVAAVRHAGTAVIVSFGGQAGPDLSRVCRSVDLLAGAFRQTVMAFPTGHVDFDLEGAALEDPAGSRRLILAVGQLERWVKSSRRRLQVSLTLPVEPTGLTASGLRVLKLARAHHVRLDVVNILAMDYGDAAAPPSQNTMAGYALAAADSAERQIAAALPGAGFSTLGITVMIGINDVSDEVFTLSDAEAVLGYAQSHGVGRLAIWSAARDRQCGGSVTTSQDDCSGIQQQPGQFSHTFDAFH